MRHQCYTVSNQGIGKMKTRIILFFGSALIFFFAGCEKAPNRLDDRADLLAPAAKNRLLEWQKKLLQVDDVELAIVTLDQPAKNLDAVSDQLFQKLKLGKQTKGDRGVLFAIDPHNRIVRLQVGYDLESVLTDAFVGRIEAEQMVPYFSADRMADGIEATVELLVSRLAETDSHPGADRRDSPFFSGGAGVRSAFPDSGLSRLIISCCNRAAWIRGSRFSRRKHSVFYTNAA